MVKICAIDRPRLGVGLSQCRVSKGGWLSVQHIFGRVFVYNVSHLASPFAQFIDNLNPHSRPPNQAQCEQVKSDYSSFRSIDLYCMSNVPNRGHLAGQATSSGLEVVALQSPWRLDLGAVHKSGEGSGDNRKADFYLHEPSDVAIRTSSASSTSSSSASSSSEEATFESCPTIQTEALVHGTTTAFPFSFEHKQFGNSLRFGLDIEMPIQNCFEKVQSPPDKEPSDKASMEPRLDNTFAAAMAVAAAAVAVASTNVNRAKTSVATLSRQYSLIENPYPAEQNFSCDNFMPHNDNVESVSPFKDEFNIEGQAYNSIRIPSIEGYAEGEEICYQSCPPFIPHNSQAGWHRYTMNTLPNLSNTMAQDIGVSDNRTIYTSYISCSNGEVCNCGEYSPQISCSLPKH
ncbi:unnamed protein product [Protopolystoma xenopodis]|uniref:Uncharacterized protein n=1 Tax=Protopolystoma xenopodis TaxID=117903 RepID=A0A3S5FDL4_9PLAT|nr:unnamed protein product [Protopolystoma xenopodis]